jgi:hypothetical protein
MKATKAVIAQRVERVLDLRLNGAELADIVHYSSAPPTGEPPWGVSPRQIGKYIQKADALCVKLFDADAKHLLNRHLLQRRRLYLRAIEDGDYRLALSILQDEAKLENLYPSDDGRPGINVNNQVAISAAEIADMFVPANR